MTELGLGLRVSVTLCFEPRADQIGSLRNALSDLCTPHISDADELSRLLLTAHELLENIVKYSAGGDVEFECTIERVIGGLRARLRTWNHADPNRLADVRARLAALGAANDAIAHYDEMIRDSAAKRDGSGLGLARIEAEGEMRLEYRIDGDELTITAEGAISDHGRP